jgi:hypothetical protein
LKRRKGEREKGRKSRNSVINSVLLRGKKLKEYKIIRHKSRHDKITEL